LATAKAETEYDYEIPDGKNVKDLSMDIKHWAGADTTIKFASLANSPENTLMYGMAFNNNKFYVKTYVSGEQKDLRFYQFGFSDENNLTLIDSGLLDFITLGDRPVVTVRDAPPDEE